MRVYEPFDWRPVAELKKNYQKPLEILNQPAVIAGVKPRIILQYLRDEEALGFIEYRFKAEQNRLK